MQEAKVPFKEIAEKEIPNCNILKVKVVHQPNPLIIKNLVNNHKPIIVTTAQILTTIIKDKHKTTNNLLLVSKVIN